MLHAAGVRDMTAEALMAEGAFRDLAIVVRAMACGGCAAASRCARTARLGGLPACHAMHARRRFLSRQPVGACWPRRCGRPSAALCSS